MPPEQTIRVIRDTDFAIVGKMTPPRDITGWAVTFRVRDALGGTSSIAKTVGGGITLTNPGKGVLTIAIDDTDTSSLTPSRDLADGKGYVWEIKRTDAGNETVLARGQFILEQEIA